MTVDIRPLAPDDLPELSRFLTVGFHAPPDAGFASPDMLRWKFLRDERQEAATSAMWHARKRRLEVVEVDRQHRRRQSAAGDPRQSPPPPAHRRRHG